MVDRHSKSCTFLMAKERRSHHIGASVLHLFFFAMADHVKWHKTLYLQRAALVECPRQSYEWGDGRGSLSPVVVFGCADTSLGALHEGLWPMHAPLCQRSTCPEESRISR